MMFRWNNRSIREAMVKLKSRGVIWSIDRFAIEYGVVSVSGWCGSERGEAVRLHLLLTYEDGQELRVDLEGEIERRDVVIRYPNVGSGVGFFAHTAVARLDVPVAVSLMVALSEDFSVRAPVPFYGKTATSEAISRLSVLRRYANRIVFHILRGNFRLIASRLKTHVPTLFARASMGGRFERLVHSLPNGLVLVMDHALGGGANHYREEIIQQHNDAGSTVLLWTYAPLATGFQMMVREPGGGHALYRVSRDEWSVLAKSRKISHVIFNNCVSYPQPEIVPTMLQAFARIRGVKLTILLHDFFTVCPSHFLVNQAGKHCGLPDVATCRACLPSISDGLVSLYRERDIDAWRRQWGALFLEADHLIAFSENTKRLFLRAYPSVPSASVEIRPHKVNYLRGQYSYPESDGRLRVAMVGNITPVKGGEVFVELVKAARNAGAPIDFSVIGSLASQQRVDGVDQTGPYEREELARLLTERRVNVVLMLSIWPETFSYVTHELIALNVPLVSFDIGAQGDAVRNYALGRVLPLSDGDVLLPQIIEFRDRLAALHGTRPAS